MFELNLKNAKDTNIVLKTKSGVTEEKMTVYEMARWLSLVESIDVVDRAAKRMKIDLKKDFKWVKPLAFQKYVEERYHSMKHDLTVEAKLGNI